MKIAVAATSSQTDAQISSHGARAEIYLIYDINTGLIESLTNPASETERGAGPQAAAFLISKGVDKVVAKDFGPKFRSVLENSGILCLVKTGKISEVIAELSKTT